MPDEKITPPAAPTKSVVEELHYMQAVYGLLIHPFTLVHFKVEEAKKHVLDDWCKVQIEAGKLKLG